MLTKRNTVH